MEANEPKRSPRATFIPNRGELKRKAVNFKKGIELKLDDQMKEKMAALVEASSNEFLTETTERLKRLRELLSQKRGNADERRQVVEQIREEAFQIKGMGGVFGFPLLTEFAKSLHDFLKADDMLDDLQTEIVSIHIDTLYVVIAHKISGTGGALEAQLRASLKAAVDKAARPKA